jgi:hypothetical protein
VIMRYGRCVVVASMCVVMTLCVRATALAQAVGSGPLTGTLTDIEPVSGVLRLGRVVVAPGVVIREIGWDSNVFDEATNPKEDYIAAFAPDVSAFTRLRFFQLSAYAGGDFNYFKTYDQERSAGSQVRGRADFLLSRVRPFIGAGRTQLRTRPNGEIDVRADRVENELSGGLAFDLSPHSLFYASAYRFRTEFEDALEEGVNLGETLNRERQEYQGGLRFDITPLTSMTVYTSFGQDRFDGDPLRDGDSVSANASVRIGAEAMLSGSVLVSYKDFKPVDPLVERFRGLTGLASLTFPVFEAGRVSVSATRGTEYSFDAEEAFYVENSLSLAYTHRIAGQVDAQIKGGWSMFDYSFRKDLPAHRDTYNSVNSSVGYNLPNRTRVSMNYEFARRRSPVLPLRNYDRRRAYLAWTFAF